MADKLLARQQQYLAQLADKRRREKDREEAEADAAKQLMAKVCVCVCARGCCMVTWRAAPCENCPICCRVVSTAV